MTVNKVIIDKIYKYINQYIQMDVGGIIINCPYWANKMKGGCVVLRGYLDGKGKADDIRQELIKRIQKKANIDFQLTPKYIQKFAKRERIGIDCSGFAYRVLEELARLKYVNCSLLDLSEVFEGGITRTNANTLTLKDYCLKVDKISDINLGDLIRMMNGRHVAVILKIEDSQIIYAHSSHLTKIQGVHLGVIKIKNLTKSLPHQHWLEETRRGENFGRKYFYEGNGDGVYRLKIFD